MKEKVRECIFLFLLPVAPIVFVVIGNFLVANKIINITYAGESEMIEVDLNSIITTVLAVFGSIIVAILGMIASEIIGWRKVRNRLKEIDEHIGVDKNRVCVSQQHENMSDSIMKNNEEIKSILNNELISTRVTVDKLYSQIDKDNREKEKVKSIIIRADGQQLNDSHQFLNALYDKYWESERQILILQQENKNLINKVDALRQENEILKNQINELSQREQVQELI